MQVDGCGISSEKETFLSSCRVREALLVFFNVLSELPSDHGSGPRGCSKTALLSNFLLVAIKTMCPNNLWSAFRTVSLFFPLVTKDLLISENVLSFCFESVS